MNYLSFEPEDFATDALFCSWVLHPTPETELFWLDWLRNNPDKARDIELARQMVLLASSDEAPAPGSETVDRIWQGIEEGKNRKVIHFPNRTIWLKAAAAVALLLVAFLFGGLALVIGLLAGTLNGAAMSTERVRNTLITLHLVNRGGCYCPTAHW